jgi:two-component system cell cycle sensor histidine kinase/response regulator CckA
MNLVINARDAMPDGGEIILKTLIANADETVPPLSGPAEQCVVLTVADSGCGIDPATISRIFEPFFTTKEQGKGTGLGLATLFGIIQQSDGNIVVDSELGKGTTFRVALPYIENADPGEREAVPHAVTGGRETILLVEDENGVRNSTAEYLASCGYDLLKARLGSEAIDIASQHETPIHLLITDIVMPKMSGRELSRKLVRLQPDMKVIFMSGYYEKPVASDEFTAQPTMVLRKPFRLTALGQRIRQVLDGEPGF